MAITSAKGRENVSISLLQHSGVAAVFPCTHTVAWGHKYRYELNMGSSLARETFPKASE